MLLTAECPIYKPTMTVSWAVPDRMSPGQSLVLGGGWQGSGGVDGAGAGAGYCLLEMV